MGSRIRIPVEADECHRQRVAHHRIGRSRPDARLRPMPRSQVRSDHPPRLRFARKFLLSDQQWLALCRARLLAEHGPVLPGSRPRCFRHRPGVRTSCETSAVRTQGQSSHQALHARGAKPGGSVRSQGGIGQVRRQGALPLRNGPGSEIGVHDVHSRAVAHLHPATVLEDGGLGNRGDPLDNLADRGA